MQFRLKRRQATIADDSERVDSEDAEQALRMRSRKSQRGVTAPRVPDNKRLRSTQTVKDGKHIFDRLSDCERTFHR